MKNKASFNLILTLIVICLLSIGHQAEAKIGKNGRIPEKFSPSLKQMQFALEYYFLNDLARSSRVTVIPNAKPSKLEFAVKKDKYVDQALNKTGLFSYLLYKDGKVVVDAKSPRERFGYLFTDKTQLNSQSIGKSFAGYLLGHAICDGYISGLDEKMNWPLLKGTMYEGQPLINFVNMKTGDEKYFRSSDVKFKNKKKRKNVNRETIKYWGQELRGKKNSKNARFSYNGLLSNIIQNYIMYKTGNNYQSLLNKVYRDQVGVADLFHIVKIKDDRATSADGFLRSTTFASRYDYLRVARAMLNDWQKDTCVGKYLKEIDRRRVKNLPKNKQDHNASWERYHYGGFFHMNIQGTKGKVFGMNGYGGQNVFINFDTGTIVVAHAVHNNYNYRKLVFSAVSK